MKNADRVYVISQGQVAEEGTHDELLAKNGLYKVLHAYTHPPAHTQTLARAYTRLRAHTHAHATRDKLPLCMQKLALRQLARDTSD